MSDSFNSYSGFSVGIPAIEVIDSNGNIISNVYNPNGSILINDVYANGFFYSNGSPYTPAAAGSNSEVQFNVDGGFGASNSFTFNTTTNTLVVSNIQTTVNANLGDVSNVTILGGANTNILQTDGTGNLSWLDINSVTAAGSNTSVQFNDDGVFGGSNNFTFDKTLNTLSVPVLNTPSIIGNPIGNISNANYSLYSQNVVGATQPNITSLGNLINLTVSNSSGIINFSNTANVTLGNIGNLHIAGGDSNYYLKTDGTGNLSWASDPGKYAAGSNTQVQFNDNGQQGAASAFTFNKDTSTLTVSNGVIANTYTGNGYFLTSINASNISGNVPFANLATYVTNNSQPNITSVGNLITLNVTGVANLSGAAQVNLPGLTDLSIPGGSNGYFLMTNGSGNLSWQPVSNGAGTPGGNTGDIQFNSNGSFGGNSTMNFNSVNSTLTIGGNLIANTFQIGSGIYKFVVSKVFFATTSSTTPDQVLWSLPVSEVASVDFTIISTDAINGTRTSTKISATNYAGQVAYNEYAGLQINGGVGVFSVVFYPGDVITPPSMRLLVTPDSAALTQYKIMICEYTV